ncbi:MAG: bifunctional molybdenum cofactor biosynthesis protein MoaC/MoaB [Oligoflexales bacterium]|nr:bifunctional molybdenum cofactor biosynthesis protein MoaC/MoaB [Oligoflexales bacterium]
MESQNTSRPSADKSNHANYHMVDVAGKNSNLRIASAEGYIYMRPSTLERIKNQSLPKGDCFTLAETAGILAAKRTADLIPLCHPLPLEKLTIQCKVDDKEQAVRVTCEAKTHSKTGVEMEALAGVHGALLTIYDVTKQVDPLLTIGSIRLLRKEGGKSGLWTYESAKEETGTQQEEKPWQGIKISTLSINDKDGSGLAKEIKLLGADLIESRFISGDLEDILANLRTMLLKTEPQLIICTGGTGLSPMDQAPEALRIIAEKEIPGIGERLRSYGSQFSASAYLNRSIAVLKNGCLIVALPNSTHAVKEAIAALKDSIPHAIELINQSNPR